MAHWRELRTRVRTVIADTEVRGVRLVDALWAVIVVLSGVPRLTVAPSSRAYLIVMWLGVAIVAAAVLVRQASLRWMTLLAIAGGVVFACSPITAVISVTLAYLLIFSALGSAREKCWRIVGACGVVLGAVFAAFWLLRVTWPHRSEMADVEWRAFGSLALCASMICLVGYMIGFARRQRRSAMELGIARAEQHWADQLLLQERERSRLAREMHDIVAHSLAVIVMQSQGARYIQSADPERAAAALETIGEVARDALTDVRALLGQLRGDDPGARSGALSRSAAHIDDLVAQVVEAGAEVHFDGVCAPPVPQWVHQPLARRALPELLINAAKHGDPAQPIRVHCLEGGGLVVSNALAHPHGVAFPQGGNGLPGLREALSEVGATVESGSVGGVWTAIVTGEAAVDTAQSTRETS